MIRGGGAAGDELRDKLFLIIIGFMDIIQVVDPVYQNHPHRRHRSIDCAYMNVV